MNKIIEEAVIDFGQILYELQNSLRELEYFCAKQRSTKATIDQRAYTMLAFHPKGFSVSIETTASALADDRFDDHVLPILSKGFSGNINGEKSGNRVLFKFRSTYTKEQWQHYCAHIFFRECQAVKTITMKEIGKLCKKIEGYQEQFDTNELVKTLNNELLKNLEKHHVSINSRARKLEEVCRHHAYYFELIERATEEVRAKSNLIDKLPKSKKTLLNGRFRWDLFFESCKNTSLGETARWCLSEIINPSYNEI